MNVQKQIDQQRVKYIVDSYQLDGEEADSFWMELQVLLDSYPSALVELALVETLVAAWLSVPLVRGHAFLNRARTQLQTWEETAIATTITPDQFQQITGLDASPIFGSEHPSLRSKAQFS
jgi:hypothetical protein